MCIKSKFEDIDFDFCHPFRALCTGAINKLASLLSVDRDFFVVSWRHLSPKIWQSNDNAGMTIAVYALLIRIGFGPNLMRLLDEMP